MDESTEAKELRKQPERAEKERDEERERNRKITLTEFLIAYHEEVASKVFVQTDKSYTSCGLTTPTNRKYPTNLRPWQNFLKHQKTVISLLSGFYPLDTSSQCFKSAPFIKQLSQDLALRPPIATEQHFIQFEQIAIREPVTYILRHLKDFPEIKHTFHMGDEVVFEDNQRTLHDSDEEHVTETPASQTLPLAKPSIHMNRDSYNSSYGGTSVLTAVPPRPVEGSCSSQHRTPWMDQICVYVNQCDSMRGRCLAFFIESKLPHKITTVDWEKGLAELDSRDFYEEVVIQKQRSTDDEASFAHEAKSWLRRH